jgi:catechol 2,3-dioxygenase-like lactoylglutathione lyase family enzyme
MVAHPRVERPKHLLARLPAISHWDDQPVSEVAEPSLVPELLVLDLDRSMGFWRDICGFTVLYERPAERFAYISLGSAHLMLEQIGIGRNWVTGDLTAPLGRGINFQISVPDVEVLLHAFRAAQLPLFMEPEVKWYRVGHEEAGVQQFLATDPDGYLIRFQSSYGRRPL